MHLILTGATGLVGSGVLDAMLNNNAITKISILSRRPVQMAEDAKDPRVHVITHKDFETYQPELLEQLKDADGCVWALGTSQNNVNKEQYITITKDYVVAAANAFSTLKPANPPFRFVHVSGEGATQEPGRFSPIFAQVKGEVESILGDISEKNPNTFRADTVRPAFVDPASHDAIKPYLPSNNGIWYKVGMVLLGPGIRQLYKSMHSPTERLGPFLTEMAMGRMDGKLEGSGVFKLGGGWVVENKGMRRILGL
ncbi:hypothetical protein N7532_000952 [Penicillium argentinense]|uniref:Nucleoside-diphosphate-sugar epimerase n=1 Tax=Penicillium argentinense TaxID=1131581 RepID=A0A9W9KM18_9EURO|nr:uncharacterized protein N7532_000952 [Penicillium argentinense]KAJ5110417.1 hypothetical protein N7532_000952 [Penicillium argentinense]